jgi:hypothetical protein
VADVEAFNPARRLGQFQKLLQRRQPRPLAGTAADFAGQCQGGVLAGDVEVAGALAADRGLDLNAAPGLGTISGMSWARTISRGGRCSR